ncbi:hypothetical protein Pcinc_029771, partial [Petrolisthes cinctipes]
MVVTVALGKAAYHDHPAQDNNDKAGGMD